MTTTVYLVCGVPGSGKTWVCEQLKDEFNYVPHDHHIGTIGHYIGRFGPESKKPILTECPFAERIARDELERGGFTVIPIFVVEDVEVVKTRYLTQRSRESPKASVTRATTIINRADEWQAFRGTSQEVLEHLRDIAADADFRPGRDYPD